MNRIDEVLSRFQDARRSGSGWQVRCPAHEDRHASLSIGEGDDGRVLLKCHAGCDTAKICGAIGLKLSDLMPESEQAKPRIVATYDYRDENSVLVMQAVRYEPKDFRQRKPKEGGGWDWKVKGVRVLPYRLPELLAGPDRKVCVVEGEKDADNLAHIGILATCNAGGAGKWTAEHAKHLAGRAVVILPDNDPPGAAHAQQVAATLAGVASSVKIILLPGLREKGDVSDWLAAGGTKEQLAKLVAETPVWSPSEPVQPVTREVKSQVKATTLMLATEKYVERVMAGEAKLIDTGVPELDYAIGGGLEPSELIIFAARPSHGKSAVALQCVHNWTEAGDKCLIISEEMSSLMLGKRTLQFLTDTPKEHWQTSRTRVVSDFVSHFKDRAECYIVENCRTATEAIKQIEHHVAEHGVTRIVVDYAQLLKSEGKGRYEQVTNTSIALRECTNQTQVVTLLLCQLNREVENRKSGFVPTMADIKDSGQWEQDADVVVSLVWPWKIDSKRDPHEYQMFVHKNRNREINQFGLTCRFLPSRQKLESSRPPAKHYDEFDKFNSEHEWKPEQLQMEEPFV